jgi:hypothetical protein
MENGRNAPSRGKGTFKFVFFLMILTGILAFFYPVLVARYPEQLATVERLRGAYHGPALSELPPGVVGFSRGMERIDAKLTDEAQEFFFVPAADHSYFVSAYSEYGEDVRLDLFDPERDGVLDSNTRYPAFSGRHADMWADSGMEPDLSHATGFSADLRSGKLYGLRLVPEDQEVVGRNVRVSVKVEDTATSVWTIWGIFCAVVFVLAVAGLILTSRRHTRS